MATVSKSGTLTRSSGTTKAFPWSVSVTQGTQSTANNTTVLNFTATVKSDTTATAWSVTNNPPQIAIYYHHVTGANAGTDSLIASATYNTMGAGETKTLTGSLTVTHTTAGKASGYAYATWTKNNSSGYVPNDANTASTRLQTATLTLTDIHRAATVTWSASSYTIAQTGTGTGASYSYTADTSMFDYSATVKVGSTTVTPSNNAITRNQILNAMPTAKTATLTVTLTTKLKGTSTVVGTSTATATVTIDTTAIKPSISIFSVTSSDSAGFYAGHSTITVVTSATNTQGATASKLTTKVTGSGNVTFSTSTATGTGSKTFTSGTIPAITTSATSQQYTVTVKVTDSRGATASTSQTITASKWTAPSITSFQAYRVASSGSSTADGGGAYVYVTYSTSKFSSGGSVTCTSSGGETVTNNGTFALATNATRKLTLTVTDALGESVSQTRTIPTALLPLDLYDNGSGSVGCGIGAVAVGGRCTIGMGLYGTFIYTGGKTGATDGESGALLNSSGRLYLYGDSTNTPGVFLRDKDDGSNNLASFYASLSSKNAYINSVGGTVNIQMAGVTKLTVASNSVVASGHIFSGGRTSYNDTAHAGVELGNNGNIYLGTITSARPSINFYVNQATSATTSITAYEADTAYGETGGVGHTRLQVAGALNATKGIFWNGHRAVMDYETGAGGHIIQLRWNSPNLEVYVDGTKVKTL